MAVHAPILDIHLGSLNRRVREAAIAEVKDSIDLAKELGASIVVVHGGVGTGYGGAAGNEFGTGFEGMC